MTKADLADRIYQKIGFSRNITSTIVNEIFNLIKESSRKGENVKISGFGTFVVKKRKGRTGKNPKTGENINIAPLKVLKFKPAQVLKKRVIEGR